jgi:thiamine monophosphate synthase
MFLNFIENNKKMDHQSPGNETTAIFNTLLSIGSATFGVVTVEKVQAWITLCASTAAFVSALFAIRYYYYATKRKINGHK